MNLTQIEKRNPSMDIVRIVAVFTVISVHFFLNTGFYSETMTGRTMFFACLARTFFGVCVPIFMILSGYLMCHKTLSRKYYLGLRKTLMTYLLASIACMIFRAVHLDVEFTLKSAVLEILGFKGAPYSWYVEMYIGLFLIIPFLNLIYNNLKNHKQKALLVGTFFCICILPTALNTFNFDSLQWWADPTSSDEFAKLIPGWWLGTYPIAYYFTGCYLREYGLKLRTRTLLLFLALSTLIFGSYNYYRSYNATFKTHAYAFWYGLQPFVLSVLLFALLSRIKGKKMSVTVKLVLWKVSDLALCMYLVSYIFDQFFYETFKKRVPQVTDRMKYYFLMVALVFLASMLLSALLLLIEFLLHKGAVKLFAIIRQVKHEHPVQLQTLVCYFLIAAVAIFAFTKAFYGLGGGDEAFYLNTPHRLLLGDALFRDEWHLSQLSGLLTLPWVAVYRLVTHSMDGIILATRFLYIILHAAVCIFMYHRFKKYGYYSVVASVLYFIFTPFDIMALSYNTMGLELLVLTCILLSTFREEQTIPFVLGGITFAGAVLCCPYLAIVFLLYGLCVLVHLLRKKQNRAHTIFDTSIFSVRTFVLFTFGIVIMFMVFLIFLLSRTSLSEVFSNLSEMLKDPEHPQISFRQKLNTIYRSIYECHEQFRLSIITYGVLLIAMIADRNRKNHRAFYLICSIGITIFSYFLFVPKLTYVYYNAIMFPMIFVGLTSYILCKKNPKMQKFFATFFMVGVIYAFCLCFSSNQYFYVISMATAITNIASIIFLGILLKQMRKRHDKVAYGKLLSYASMAFACFAMILLGYFELNAKVEHYFWEAGGRDSLTTKMTAGPAKGIYTTEEKAKDYETIYNDLMTYKNDARGTILILSERTWCYLALNDFPYGAFSGWLSGENDTTLSRLETYYSMNPNKIPFYIYIPKDSKWDFASLLNNLQSKGYTVEETEVSYKLTKTN